MVLMLVQNTDTVKPSQKTAQIPLVLCDFVVQSSYKRSSEVYKSQKLANELRSIMKTLQNIGNTFKMFHADNNLICDATPGIVRYFYTSGAYWRFPYKKTHVCNDKNYSIVTVVRKC